MLFFLSFYVLHDLMYANLDVYFVCLYTLLNFPELVVMYKFCNKKNCGD